MHSAEESPCQPSTGTDSAGGVIVYRLRVLRCLTLERSIPLQRINQCVGFQTPMRNLFVPISVRSWIIEIRLGHQKSVDECIDDFNGQERDINGGVQTNTAVIVMLQGPFLKYLNIAAIRNFSVLCL
ncbi:hypothetical protein Rfer_1180 [Rhodoferax ferrireducens T118]|uniref:Uncharacterized protein n=1 Tax=Albidiferax ferrireducens (strain ATCC BAA-621 / DSM 15236 / T118) TaxID=338969 RepID=Q21Z87_ALBFT|nr:hypothetical protein Rfer_1180 [Rhodoferax ferrireducens T118]